MNTCFHKVVRRLILPVRVAIDHSICLMSVNSLQALPAPHWVRSHLSFFSSFSTHGTEYNCANGIFHSASRFLSFSYTDYSVQYCTIPCFALPRPSVKRDSSLQLTLTGVVIVVLSFTHLLVSTACLNASTLNTHPPRGCLTLLVSSCPLDLLESIPSMSDLSPNEGKQGVT